MHSSLVPLFIVAAALAGASGATPDEAFAGHQAFAGHLATSSLDGDQSCSCCAGASVGNPPWPRPVGACCRVDTSAGAIITNVNAEANLTAEATTTTQQHTRLPPVSRQGRPGEPISHARACTAQCTAQAAPTVDTIQDTAETPELTLSPSTINTKNIADKGAAVTGGRPPDRVPTDILTTPGRPRACAPQHLHTNHQVLFPEDLVTTNNTANIVGQGDNTLPSAQEVSLVYV